MEEPRAFLGVGANPRGAPGNDPLLTEAYLDVLQGGFPVAAFRIDWGEIESRLANYTWTTVDDHVRQAIARDVRLSVEVSLIDRTVLGTLPADLRGQDLESTNLQVRFARFAQLLLARGQGRLDFLWIGREVDRYIEGQLSPEEQRTALAELLEATRDSLESIELTLPIGTSLSATDLAGNSAAVAYQGIVDASDQIGWTVYGRDDLFVQSLSPEQTLELAQTAVETFPGVPAIVTEIGFPGEGRTDPAQVEFVSRLTGWLESPPEDLLGAFFPWISDLHFTFARDRAARLFPDDKVRRGNLEGQLRSLGLKEENGVPTDAWRRVQSWNLELPG